MFDRTDQQDRTTRHRVNGHHDGDPAGSLALAIADEPPVPPSGVVVQPPAPSDPAARRWLPAQIASEIQLAFRMYFDPRYRVSRAAQLLVPLTLGLFALNYFAFGVWLTIPVLSPILERVVCVLLGVYLYRLVTRELARYRAVLEYLARYGPP